MLCVAEQPGRPVASPRPAGSATLSLGPLATGRIMPAFPPSMADPEFSSHGDAPSLRSQGWWEGGSVVVIACPLLPVEPPVIL